MDLGELLREIGGTVETIGAALPYLEGWSSLATRALAGDPLATAELEQRARSPDPAQAMAARALLEYVDARRELGRAAAGIALEAYPGLVIVPVGLAVAGGALLVTVTAALAYRAGRKRGR